MKKQKKKLIITLLILILITCICNIVIGYQGMANSVNVSGYSGSKKITERMLGTIQMAGTVISVAALVVIGIRYMVSSVDEKASLKGILGYYVVGAVLVFATVNIVSIAYKIITNIK